MPQFAFIAKDRMGNTVRGDVDAANEAFAANKVGQMGYSLVELRPAMPGAAMPTPPALLTPTAPPPAEPMGRTQAIPNTARPSDLTQAVPPARPAELTQAMSPAAPRSSDSPQGTGAGAASSPRSPDSLQSPGAVPAGSLEQQAPTDLLRQDAAKRRAVEVDLARMGMKPDEIRRLLDANPNTTAASSVSSLAIPPTTAAPLPPVAATKAAKKAGAQQKVAARAADLQSFAAQLQSSAASNRVQAVEAVDLNLPDFRPSTPKEREQAEVMLREVYALRRREKYTEAIAKCREALTLVPSDAAALEMFGDLLQGVARTEEAMSAYKRATEADSKRASAERKYGDLLMRQQRWSEADPEEAPRNPIAAAAFSLLIPGAGQIHNGERLKGAILLAFAGLAIAILIFLMRDKTEYEPSSRKPVTRTTSTKHEKAAPIDWGAETPVMGCILFYGALAVGSAFDAAAGARRTRLHS